MASHTHQIVRWAFRDSDWAGDIDTGRTTTWYCPWFLTESSSVHESVANTLFKRFNIYLVIWFCHPILGLILSCWILTFDAMPSHWKIYPRVCGKCLSSKGLTPYVHMTYLKEAINEGNKVVTRKFPAYICTYLFWCFPCRSIHKLKISFSMEIWASPHQ